MRSGGTPAARRLSAVILVPDCDRRLSGGSSTTAASMAPLLGQVADHVTAADPRLADIDLKVLKAMIKKSIAATRKAYPQR